MGDQDKNSERIQDYLSGDLSKSQRLDFENELQNNDDLRSELQLYQNVNEELGNTTVSDFRKQLEKFNQEEDHSSNAHSRPKNRRWIIIFSVLIILAAFILWKVNNQPNTAEKVDLIIAQIDPADVLGPMPGNRDERSNEPTIEVPMLFLKAQQAIDNQLYEQAKSYLTQLSDTDQVVLGEKYDFSLGLMQLLTREYDNAISSFRKTSDDKYPNRHWYLALAFIQINNLDSTRFHLEQLLKLSNNTNLKLKATSLLESLN